MAKKSTKLNNKKIITEIYESFYLPLLRAKPKDIFWLDWFDYLCGVNSRFISRFIVIAPVSIQGKSKESDALSTVFKLRKGVEVFVRVDADEPLIVHVEVSSGNRNKGEWFLTSRSEWRKALKCLKHKPFRNTQRENNQWDVTQFF